MGPNRWNPSSLTDHSRTSARFHLVSPRKPSSCLSALSTLFVAVLATGTMKSPFSVAITTDATASGASLILPPAGGGASVSRGPRRPAGGGGGWAAGGGAPRRNSASGVALGRPRLGLALALNQSLDGIEYGKWRVLGVGSDEDDKRN